MSTAYPTSTRVPSAARRSLGPALVLAAALASGPAGAEWVLVRRVVDGDTFVTPTGTNVRVLDIDTAQTHHPDKRREPGGEEAARLARFFPQGNYVWLEGNVTDKYGRRLARVQLPGRAWYRDIVRAHGYDKRTRRVYAQTGPGQAPAPLMRNPYRYTSGDDGVGEGPLPGRRGLGARPPPREDAQAAADQSVTGRPP